MRSIWAIVVACLVAAAGVRPIDRIALDRDRGAMLVRGHGALAVLARRDRDRRPELQLPVAVLPEPLAISPPGVAIELMLEAARGVAISGPRTPRSSRGPPRA